uniref:ELM2 domain-containing protein n=1 Tax=Angiostrongylus cantonensis TaxID=6313 RepID=A0A0K0D328_ANGCA
LPSNRQSTEITLGRPHSLQLGASSQDNTKPSFAKWRHKNKKRTVTRAPLFPTNRLSPISEESPDIMFNGNDVMYEECCDNVATKTDNDTFRPRANAKEQTKGTRWDDILGEIDGEIVCKGQFRRDIYSLDTKEAPEGRRDLRWEFCHLDQI